MTDLSLPQSTIKKIIDDPTILGNRLSNSTSGELTQLGVSQEAATHILGGYTRGFRIVFILNACLAATATLASITMIKHKELTRSDDEEKKLEAKRALKEQRHAVDEKSAITASEGHVPPTEGKDAEMGLAQSQEGKK